MPRQYAEVVRTLADKATADDGFTIGSLMTDRGLVASRRMADATGVPVSEIDGFLKTRIRFPQVY